VALTPAVENLAPSTPTSPPATTRFARLRVYIGAVVGAAAAAFGAALGESENGGLTEATKVQGGKLLCELFKLRQCIIADFPNFDTLARECGEETLRACDVNPATANILVDNVMNILAKITQNRLN